MKDAVAALAALVDANAHVLEIPLVGEDRASVVAAMTRIAAFAADVAAFPLADDVEIASAPVL